MFLFGKLPLTVIQFPSGRFGFVGSVPTALCAAIPATRSDVAGGRAFRGDDGSFLTWKSPVFDNEADALEFARGKGFAPSTPVAA